MAHEPALGDNLRRWRRRRGYSQEELAERAGVSVSVVRKLEQDDEAAAQRQGVRLETLYKLARALDVQTAQLLTPRGPEPLDQDPTQQALLPIRVALTPPLQVTGVTAFGGQPTEPDVAVLRNQLDEAVRLYRDDRYEATALLLPEMVAAAHATVACYDHGNERIDALRLRSDVLQLAGWFLTQVGASDLAYQALKDAIADANAVEDPLAAAAGVIGECWLFIRQGRLLDAMRTAVAAADRVEPRLSKASVAELSAWGWLLLRGWAAAVRNNQEPEALELLRMAQAAAAGMGEETQTSRYHQYWTTFGPATVAMKATEHRVVIGDWKGALTLAERVPPSGRRRSDNRNRHELDKAKAHAELGDYTDALDILTHLRTTSPQWLRHQRMGRGVTRMVLVSRKRTLTEQMRELADFYDIDA
ncbi:MAG: helix-turn-helix domain-containing protein [Egibacteraceae bacterium]